MSRLFLIGTEGVLGLLGASCLLVYGLSQWDATWAQSSAIAKFRSQRGIEAPDQRRWSEKRIAEFQRAKSASEVPEPLGLLTIDRLGVEVAVFDGATHRLLSLGAGRITGTARIGGEGNLGIAAHRDGFFRGLKDAEIGDQITFRHSGGIDRFEVTKMWVVDPEEVSVLAPTETRSITLVTCYPFYFVGSAPQRFIVRGVVLSDAKSVANQ